MHEHSIPCPELVFPVLLPLGECVLFKHFVGSNYEQWCASLEANTPLYADDSVAYVHVASYGIGCNDLFKVLDSGHLVGVMFPVDGSDFAFFKRQSYAAVGCGCHLCRVGFFWQGLVAV